MKDEYGNPFSWTQVGANVVVTNNKLEFQSGAICGEQRRVHRPLITTLDSCDFWCAELDFEFNSATPGIGSGHFLLALTAGTQEPYNDCPNIPCTGYPAGTQDCIVINLGSSTPTTADQRFQIFAREGSASQEYQSSPIPLPQANTPYYLRLERTTCFSLRLSVFSDPAMTQHVSSSPVTLGIPNTISGLTHVQHGTAARGNQARGLNGWIDNLCITKKLEVSRDESPIQESSFSVFPNPGSGTFRIEGQGWRHAQLKVADAYGRIVFERPNQWPGDNLNLQHLDQGIYFIRLETGNQTIVSKLLIRK